jgi:hypothetical protein
MNLLMRSRLWQGSDWLFASSPKCKTTVTIVLKLCPTSLYSCPQLLLQADVLELVQIAVQHSVLEY